jgi:hypothetical protein
MKNILSSSTLYDQSQEGQSNSQKEETKSASLGKSDCPISQTEGSDFGRIENILSKKMIALHQVPMMMMAQMMSIMNKNSWWSLRNS